MSVIAHITVPAEQFPLGEVLEVRPGVQIRLESMIPTGEAVIPYFWVATDDVEAIEEALRGSSLVDDVRIVDEVDDETLFRVTWSAEVDGLIDALVDTDAIILDGAGMGDDWSFQLRFADHTDLSRFYRSCVDEGITVRLDELYNPLGTSGSEFGITDEQREALLTALEAGYFAVPRNVTLVDLAERLGISDSAVSQRLRRGLTTILSATLASDSIGDRPGVDDDGDD